METIEQSLNNWLEEYTANKGLHDRLSLVLEENSKNNTLDAATVLLTKRDAKILLDGLNKIIQSNKESIMDCSYNIIQWRKNKSNEDNTHLEQTNNTLKEVKQETIDTKKIDLYDADPEKVINRFKTNVHIENIKMFEELLEILSTIEKSIVIYPKFKNNPENKNEKELVAIISHILGESDDEASATLHDDICESSAILYYNDLLKHRLILKNFIELGGILLIKIDILEQ